MSAPAVPSRPADPVLQAFVEAVIDPCVVLDPQGRVLAVNRAWQDLPRKDEAASMAKNPIGADYLVLFKTSTGNRSLDLALKGTKDVLEGLRDQFEHEYIRPIPPSIRWYRMTVRPWRQAGAAVVIFHRDITAERMGNGTSTSMDQEFRSLADSAPVMIWMTDADQMCTFVSRKWLEFTGVGVEDALGEVTLEVVHPEDRAALMDAFQTAYDRKSEYSHEYRLRHVDDGYRWVLDTGSPRFDAHHQFSGFTGSVWDLSDQKRTSDEAQKISRYARLAREVAVISNSASTLRDALQRSVDLICETLGFPVGHALLIHDDQPELAQSSHVVYVKDMQRFKALFDISTQLTWPAAKGAPGEVLQSHKPAVHDVLENTKAPHLYPRNQAALEAGLRTSFFFPVLVDDRVEAILEFASEEALSGDEELVNALTGASERIARYFERRRAQIEFLKQREELEVSAEQLLSIAGRLIDSQEEERRRIAREIHDDFTQRLAMVSMKLGNLAGGEQSTTLAEWRAGLEDIRRATTSIANDLRDLSHQLHPAMLELLGLVAAMRAQCDEFQRTWNIATVCEMTVSDEDASPKATICLYRVLQEGLMNIAKHSGSGTARVSLESRGGQLELRIRDEGRGIDPGAEGRQRMGLTSIEERVRLLNGKFSVNNNPGSGTEIFVSIPSERRV